MPTTSTFRRTVWGIIAAVVVLILVTGEIVFRHFTNPQRLQSRARQRMDKLMEDSRKSVTTYETTLSARYGETAAFRRGRQRVADLTSDWLFAVDPGGKGTEERWFRENLDRQNWLVASAGMNWHKFKKGYYGNAWYAKNFDVPEAAKGKHLELLFEGVNEDCWVYLNEQEVFSRVAKRRGDLWRYAFRIPVSDLIRYGEKNLLVVRVHETSLQAGIYNPVQLMENIWASGLADSELRARLTRDNLTSDATDALFYVSTGGNDSWSGRSPEPHTDKTDGPFATLAGARDDLRRLRQAGELKGPATVLLREGRYAIAEPVVFKPEDSGPTTYAAYPGEQPVLDGGIRIREWRVETRGRHTLWVAELPEVAADKWYFRQLFVNGQRRNRPRLPKKGKFRIAGIPQGRAKPKSWRGTNVFRCAAGDIQAWKHLSDIDVVIYHRWIEERMPIAAYDAETRVLTSSRWSVFPLTDEEYFLENVAEALSEPGEWYLERTTGRLSYIPMPGEDPGTAAVYAPRVAQLLKLAGRPESGQYVKALRFIGLGFEHTQWRQMRGGGSRRKHIDFDLAGAMQASHNLPGAISIVGARHCAIEDCSIRHTGWYGVELTGGCQYNRIVGNTITDLGAGGIKLEGIGVSHKVTPVQQQTGHNTITDNHIFAGGKVFASGVGILGLDVFDNEISHNHIHDLFYTGISCGWTWGYAEHSAKNNRIEKNHIHDIGQGVLSDMGGIYTLGVQPGTVIRGNLIHDVQTSSGHGFGIYLDEGSSHVVVENNICHTVSNYPFFVHFGRENLVRNNIFAFGKKGAAALGRAERHNSFTLARNILLTNGAPALQGFFDPITKAPIVISDLNLVWDVGGNPMTGSEISADGIERGFTLEQWQARGCDIHSVAADPRFRDSAAFDFTLEDDSPAFGLGFTPIEISDVGPRTRHKRMPN